MLVVSLLIYLFHLSLLNTKSFLIGSYSGHSSERRLCSGSNAQCLCSQLCTLEHIGRVGVGFEALRLEPSRMERWKGAILVSFLAFALHWQRLENHGWISVTCIFQLPTMLPGISIIKFLKISNKTSHKV